MSKNSFYKCGPASEAEQRVACANLVPKLNRHTHSLILSVVLLLSSSSASFAGTKKHSRLENADGSNHVSHTREKMNGKNYHVSRAVINANPESVWKVLTDYKNATVTVPNVQKLKILKSEQDKKKVWFSVKFLSGFRQFEYTVNVRENRPHRIEWQRDSGDFKRYEGYWELRPLDNGKQTLLTYAKHVDGGFFLPQMFVDGELKKTMPFIMQSVQKAVEKRQLAEL